MLPLRLLRLFPELLTSNLLPHKHSTLWRFGCISPKQTANFATLASAARIRTRRCQAAVQYGTGQSGLLTGDAEWIFYSHPGKPVQGVTADGVASLHLNALAALLNWPNYNAPDKCLPIVYSSTPHLLSMAALLEST